MQKNLLFINCLWANRRNRSLCSISLIEYDFNSERILDSYQSLINPNDSFDYRATSYHHLDKDSIRNAPHFKEIWSKIQDYFENDIIVGYNLESNDLYSLRANLKRYKLKVPNFRYIDIAELAAKYLSLNDIKDYRLTTVLRYYGIYHPQIYATRDYTLANLRLFKVIVKDYKVNVLEWIRNFENNTEYEFKYDKQISSGNLTELYGLLKGLECDEELSELELSYLALWYEYNRFNDEGKKLTKIIEEIIETGKISNSQYLSLIKVLERQIEAAKTTKDSKSLRILQGFIKGILADQELNDIEILKLKIWLEENLQLKGQYPYDIIYDKLNDLLLKKSLSFKERSDFYHLLDQFINPLKYRKIQKIEIKNKNFVLSGDFDYGSKLEVKEYLLSRGANVFNNVSKKIDYVLVGNRGSNLYVAKAYGTKVKKALELGLNVISENAVFD